MDLTTIGLAVSIIGVVITVGLFVLSTLQLRHGIKTAFDMDIRKTIDRIERNKEKFKQSAPEAYEELFDIQDELETISKKFLAMFKTK